MLCFSLVFSPIFAEPIASVAPNDTPSKDSIPSAIAPSDVLNNPAPSSLNPILSIVPDTSDANYAPSIDKAPNNIEIINITSPNQFGISNNHYLDFNIKEVGAIINNSNNPITPSQLGGLITSNPNFGDKEASLILNQVTSSHPSNLLGHLEVAGKAAGVLIANPNGISCEGCSFSNATSVSLTTGFIPPSELSALTQLSRESLNSHLSTPSTLAQELTHNLHFRVTKGHINIDSLNSLNIPSLNILSKSLSASHTLYAKNLNIILGSNDISLDQKGALLLWQPLTDKNPDEQKTSKLALDVAYIGGVYANSIYLIASDEDSVIKNSGILATFPSSEEGDGGFYIDINGHLAVSSPEAKAISANANTSSSDVFSTDTNDNISNSSSLNPPNGIYASKSLNIKAKSLQNDSVIQTQKDSSFNLQESFINKGSIISWGNLELSSNSLDNAKAFIYANTLKSTTEYFNNTDSSFILAKSVFLNSKELNNIHSMIYSGDELSINTNNISNIAHVSLRKKLISQEHISQGEWNKAASNNGFNPFRFLKDGDKDFTRSIYQEILDTSNYSPSIIMSAKKLFIQADVLNNQNASIISPIAEISANTFNSDIIQAREITEDKGREARNYQDIWYEKECRGIDWLTLCIKQTNVRHEVTRLKVFDDYFKESSSYATLTLPSLEEDLAFYLKNSHVSFYSNSSNDTKDSSIPSDNSSASFSVSNSLEILDSSHSLEFLIFNPYDTLAVVDVSKNPSIALKDRIYTDAKVFISSDYFYNHFKNTSNVSVFLSYLKNSSMQSSYLSSFYNSKSFLNESLHLEKLDRMLASYEANHLAHKIEIFKENTQESSYSDFFNQKDKGIFASKLDITSASFYNNSYIYAENTKIDSKDKLINKGSIHSKDLLLSSEGRLYHSGEIVSKSTILSAQDIDLSSEIKSFNAYLSNSNSPKYSQETLLKVASITADNLNIQSFGDVSVSGADFKVKDKLSLEGGMVSINSRELEDSYQDSFKQTRHLAHQRNHFFASSISIKAKENLDIEGSDISAQDDLHLYSDGDIHLLASDDQDSLKKDFYSEKKGFLSLSTDHNSTKESSILQKDNVFKASNIQIQTKGSIISNGGDYEAKNELKILADKDYIQTALHNSYSRENSNISDKRVLGIDFSGDTLEDNAQSQSYIHSTLAGKNIFIQTGGDTTLTGVQLSSQEKTSILVGGSFTLLNPKNTDVQTTNSSHHSFAGLFSDKGDNYHQEISQNSSSITAGSLDIKAHKNIHILDSHISTSGDAMLFAQEGNINIINDYNSISSKSSSNSKDFNGLTFKFEEKLSAGVDFKYENKHSEDFQKQALGSLFDIGGNLVLKTGDEGDINIIASTLLADKNIFLDSKNVHIYSALDSSTSKEQNLEGHLNISLNVGNAYADVYFAGDKFYKSLENFNKLKKQYNHNKELYKQGKMSKNALDEFKYNLGFASLNIANASLAMTSSVSGAASAASTSYGTGFYTSVSSKISGTQKNKDEQNTFVVASSLKAGENIIIQAQDSISQIGSHSQVKGAIVYKAKNNIDILSSLSSHHFTKETKEISTSTSYGNNGFSFDTEIGGSREREVSSTSVISSLKSQNIALFTPKDIHINGGVLTSKNAVITADNLSVISSSDSKYSHMNSASASTGYGSSSINGGFSKTKGNTDKQWVQEQSGIFAQNQLKLNVAHHTYLEAAYLISGSDELFFNTDTFSYKDKENKDYISSKGISVSLQSDNQLFSHSSIQIGLSKEGSVTEGKTLATLGKGEIFIANPDGLIHTINRDISKSSAITQDKITAALNANVQIDNRLFSQKGRESIYEDIISLPNNLIKTTNGVLTLAFNPLISATEVLFNPDISLHEVFNQWKSNQSAAVAINNLDRKTFNDLSSGQDITDIIAAIKGENHDRVHIYYDETDGVNGFYDNKNKQIYLNAANNIATDTKTFVKTYTHENAHRFTHNDNIANNAGSYGNFSYHLSNFLGFSHINTKGIPTQNKDNTTTYTPISSKQWYENQISNTGFNHKSYPTLNNDFNLNNNNHKDNNPDKQNNPDNSDNNNHFKDILDYNNHQASLVEQEDRDNFLNPIWDIGNIVYDALAYSYYSIKGDREGKKDSLIDLTADGVSLFIPFIPAGITKATRGTYKATKNIAKNVQSQTKERKVNVYQPGAPNIDGKIFTKKKGNQGYVDQDGNIYQRDRQHKGWEVYNKRGEHKGEIDHNGNKTDDAIKGRRIKP
ncbi:hemagglutinin repeat-containing protein [Helicobacter cappadocius]|uniref:Hemagglutinin repeat-containing protein n=1 Tax=Helicobacter cappadocius TaxID=3063998 RepID=A0AA90PJY8_9HELI|nr:MULTISPECIES: hemagglutinin repeat-containing protein [unclassified Helicobacter]MDO7252687.1 hemagglutinin repeat-containing protein [Helicobacter sp. faydin-H75]MDP2538554.1 hemagglutinin repeat-containing protein [Helicobacter sp. faydin-H76]